MSVVNKNLCILGLLLFLVLLILYFILTIVLELKEWWIAW